MIWQFISAGTLWIAAAALVYLKKPLWAWTLPALAAAALTAFCVPYGCALAALFYGAMTIWHMARREKTITGAVIMALVFAAAGIYGAYTFPAQGGKYELAMEDAAFAEPDEIRELVEIVPGTPLTTWDGGRVLMLSWHSGEYADSGSATAGADGIWTFTDGELRKWFEKSGGDGEADIRLEQLIGLPEGSGCTHVTAFWCDPEELIRPAYVTDITAQITPESLDGSELGDYREWFDANILWSYFYSAYPWTRLGYTYDWSGGDEYGLSEFLILPGAETEIEWTKTTEEFWEWLKEAT